MIYNDEPTVNIRLYDFKKLESAADVLEKMLYNPSVKLIVGRSGETVYFVPNDNEFATEMVDRLQKSEQKYSALRADFNLLMDQRNKK